MEFINKSELLQALEKRLGDMNDTSGCYNGKEWFCNALILEIVNGMQTYE